MAAPATIRNATVPNTMLNINSLLGRNRARVEHNARGSNVRTAKRDKNVIGAATSSPSVNAFDTPLNSIIEAGKIRTRYAIEIAAAKARITRVLIIEDMGCD